MTRRKIKLTAVTALPVVLGIGASSISASAQGYPACAPGYYYWAGYCYPYDYGYPSAYYGAPFFFPSVGIGFGFGFHDHFHDHFHDGFRGGTPMMSGGFHGGGFHR